VSKKNLIIVIAIAALWIAFLVWASLETAKFSEKRAAKKQEPKKDTIMSKKKALLERQEEEEFPVMVRAFKVKKTDFTDTLPVMGSIKGESEIPLKLVKE